MFCTVWLSVFLYAMVFLFVGLYCIYYRFKTHYEFLYDCGRYFLLMKQICLLCAVCVMLVKLLYLKYKKREVLFYVCSCGN